MKKQIESLKKSIAEMNEQMTDKEKLLKDLQLQFERQVPCFTSNCNVTFNKLMWGCYFAC